MPHFSGRRASSLLLLMGALALSACEAKPVAPPPPPPPPAVTIAKPVVRKVIQWDEYTGRLAARETVEIRARVNGYLQTVNFRDGQIVQKGELLFVIDPRPYEAVLKTAKAEVTQVLTRLELAKNDLERAEQLLKTKAISTEEFDTRSKAVREAEAAVEAARARVDAAALDVEFTQITAPITGRIGRTLIDPGNLITGGAGTSTLLTTIVSLNPIHCYFDANEQAYLRYVRLNASGKRVSSREVATPVFVGLSDEEGFPHVGHMDFVDNQIDPATGTMRGRAILDNDDMTLTPGLFVRVRLLGSGEFEAIQIPDEAIGTDQAQRFVFVVKPDNTVEHRQVTVGEMIDGLRVITEGLNPEDAIIIEGLQRARTGEAVTPTLVEIPEPPRDTSLDNLPPTARYDQSPGSSPVADLTPVDPA